MNDNGIKKFERALLGMNSLETHFIDVGYKHHGHQEDFVEEMFVIGFDGVPLVDEDGKVMHRGENLGEDDVPDDDEMDVPF